MILTRGLGFRISIHPLSHIVIFLSIITGSFLELITLLTIVLIHELGHVYAAKGFGWKVIEVQILPFGGVAIVEEPGAVPAREEIIVALAGPLQNGCLAGIAWLMMWTGVWDEAWCHYLIKVNAMIGLFNLLPILPLDGGKMMQGLVSLRVGYYRTLAVCAWISLSLSALMLIVGIYASVKGGIQVNLLAIAAFLTYSNWVNWRNIPYFFVRFLMHRQVRMAEWRKRGTANVPILANRSQTVSSIVKLFMREKPHLIYLLGDVGQIERIVGEQLLVHRYFSRPPGKYAASKLFMIK